MDLRQLRNFVAVADAGHITRAASALGMQQPPLSQQIKALESRLGTELFLRHPKGVSLTAAGEALLVDSRRLLEDAAAMERRMRDRAAGRAGTLAIGFTSSAAAHGFTPRVLRECRQAFPGIALTITEDHAAGLTGALTSGRLHCAFLRVPVSRPAGLIFETLLREPVMVALPTGHPALSQDGPLPLASLAHERFILVRQQGAPGLYAQLLLLCERLGFTPTAAHEVDRMMTALNLVAAGDGVTVVPASMRGAHPDAIVFRPLADPGLDAPLTLAWRQDDPDPALGSFVALVRQAIAAAVPP